MEAVILQLVYRNESCLDHYIGSFVKAFDNGHESKKEDALISTIAVAVNLGISADDLVTAFSAYGIGSERFITNIANRFILTEAI